MRCFKLLECANKQVEVSEETWEFFLNCTYSDPFVNSIAPLPDPLVNSIALTPEGVMVSMFFFFLTCKCKSLLFELLSFTSKYSRRLLRFLSVNILNFIDKDNVFKLLVHVYDHDVQDKVLIANKIMHYLNTEKHQPDEEDVRLLEPHPELLAHVRSAHTELFSFGKPTNSGSPNFRTSLKELFNSGLHADVKLVVNGERELLLHRCLVCPLWDFFPRYFLGHYKADENGVFVSNTNSAMPTKHFVSLISFFYGRKISLDMSFAEAAWFLSTAEYYDFSDSPTLKPMLVIAEHKLSSKIVPPKALEALKLALETEQPDIKERALTVLKKRRTPEEVTNILKKLQAEVDAERSNKMQG